MKKNRYSPEQIIYALKQVESGEKAVDICRKMGVSEATFYNWKKKYGVTSIECHFASST